MTKKKKETNPEIVESGKLSDKQFNQLRGVADQLKESVYTPPNKDEDESDSFFKSVLSKLFDTKDISTKTEYLDVVENYVGTKLTFLSQYGNMPYLEKFVEIFETKRVSLERKGRQEIIMALREREQEQQAQQQSRLKQLFGIP